MNTFISNGKRFLAAKQSTFPGGETFVRLENDAAFHDESENKYLIHARIQNAGDLFSIAIYKDALEREVSGCEISLFMPYVPYARQDRVCYPGESLSIRVLARFINSLGFSRVGIADPHSDVTPALLDRCWVISQAEIVGDWLEFGQHFRDGILLSPDAGAIKKTAAIAKEWEPAETVGAEKVRDTATGDITGVKIPRWFEGQTLICCDDICDGGRTFIELAKVAKAQGAGKFILYVTHGIFSKGVDVLFDSGIDEIWTTNSFHESYDQRVKVRDIFNPAGMESACASIR